MAFALYADMDVGDDHDVQSTTELATSASIRKRQVPGHVADVAQVAKKGKSERPTAGRRELGFPSHSAIEEMSRQQSTAPYQWASSFVASLRTAQLEHPPQLAVPRGSKIKFFSEFSGSGAAEAALHAVAGALGADLRISSSYCADLDAGCRRVLQSSCHILS